MLQLSAFKRYGIKSESFFFTLYANKIKRELEEEKEKGKSGRQQNIVKMPENGKSPGLTVQDLFPMFILFPSLCILNMSLPCSGC